MRLSLILLFAAGCVTSPAPRSDDAVTTVLVVRHAEKGTEPKENPPLTEAGAARAVALSDALKDRPIAAIYSTDTLRTRSTAAPTAARLGLAVATYDQAIADDVRAKHRGQTVLVVGHSNTVAGIVEALGAPRPKDLCDGEFHHLFVVTVPASGAATVEDRAYGAPSANPGCPAR